MRYLPFLILAAMLHAGPASALVIGIVSTQEQGEEITPPAGATSGRLQGIIEGRVGGQYLGSPPAAVTILAAIEVVGLGQSGTQVIDLAPASVPATASGGSYSASFTIPVDVTVDLTGYEYFIITPDFIVSPGTNPGTFSESGTFAGTLTVAAPIPEPASLALLGLGLAGVLAQRRRSRVPQPAAPRSE